MTIEDEISSHWKCCEIPLIDALMFADGRIVLFRSFTVAEEGTVRTGVRRVAETTLESVLSNAPDPWFKLEPLCSVCDQSVSIRYLAGGGDMGNEGFIAAERLSDKHLLWVASFNRSNPFSDIRVAGETVIATNNHDEDWIVPLDDPGRLWVDHNPE